MDPSQVGDPLSVEDPDCSGSCATDDSQEFLYGISTDKDGDNHDSAFTVGFCSGQIMTNKELSYNKKNTYLLNLSVTDLGG